MEYQKKESLEFIKIINGRWTLNGKTFNELSLSERFLMQEKILTL